MKARKYLNLSLITILLVTLCIGLVACEKKQPKGTITVCSYGGAYQESQQKAFFEPAEKEIGITVKDTSYNGEFAKIKAMVETGNVTWDVVDVETSMVIRGAEEGILEPIDYNLINKDQLIPDSVHPYGIGDVVWSTVLAYSTKKYPKGTPHPTTWAEFWDVEKFPGPRALRKSPKANLEFALLADGVPKDKLYPLDVDRAFRSLDKIKPHITVWWEAGDQPRQLLSDGEVVLTSAYNGRIWAAIQDGEPVAIEWGEAIMDLDWWVVPKGAKKDLAMRFLAFATSPKQQALQTKYIAYGPTNKEAIKLVDQKTAPDLPTEPTNLAKQFTMNNEWWAKHEAEVTERWNAWLLK